jgi:O-antigen/teichoic acid export membrane protein/serine acetyltransferase
MTRVAHVLSEARHVLASRLLQPLSAFVLLIIIGRNSDRLLGEYALVSTAYFILQTLPLLGLSPFVVREAARDPGRVKALLVGIGGLAVAAALALGAVWWQLRDRLDYPASTRDALDVVAIGIVWGILAYLCEALLVCLHRAGVVSRIATYENLGRLATSLAVLTWAPSVRNLFIVFFAGRALALTAMAIALAGQRLGPIRRGDLARLAREVRPQLPAFLGATLLALAASRLDYLVLSLNADLALLGRYAVSYRYLEIAVMGVAAVVAAAYPRLSRIFHHDPQRFRTVARALIEIALLGLPMLALGAVLAADAYVGLLFPRQHPQAVALAEAFAALIALIGLDILLGALLQSCDRQRDDLRAQAVGTVILGLGLLLLVPRFLGWGAFWSAFAAVATQAGLRLMTLRRRLDLRLPWRIVGMLAAIASFSLLGTIAIAHDIGRGPRLLLVPVVPPLVALATLILVHLHPGAWLRALARPLAPGESWNDARLGDTLRLMAEDQRARDRVLTPDGERPALQNHAALAVMLYRLSRWLTLSGHRLAGRSLSQFNLFLSKAELPPTARIGPGFVATHSVGLVVVGAAGSRLTMRAWSAMVVRGRTDYGASSVGLPRLGDDSFLGVRAVVRGGLRGVDGLTVPHHGLIVKDRHLARLARDRADAEVA